MTPQGVEKIKRLYDEGVPQKAIAARFGVSRSAICRIVGLKVECEVKTFTDLQFEPHPSGDGLAARMHFENGYGISVVRFKMRGFGFSQDFGYGSYPDNDQQWEVAVLKGNKLCYETPITSDVLARQSDDDVSDVMKRIQELPPAL